ncbi:MAG: thioredoxin family protein [Synechococcales bacterium]|nr:thioredoxin family protein [Synechococcales bacterium]
MAENPSNSPTPESSTATTLPPESSPHAIPPAPQFSNTGLVQKARNLLIVLVAVVLGAALFLGMQTPTGSANLASLAAAATPYEVALTNQKPTFLEFYANWCTSCQAMAADLAELKADYGDRVNFVMLNVDNSKWLPELLEYRVDGIPHFVYLDASGEAIANVIGEQPQTMIAENLDALIAAAPLPHLQTRGRTSSVEAGALTPQNDDPRSHGSQVIAN